MNLIDTDHLEVGKFYELVRAKATRGPIDWRNIELTKYLGCYIDQRLVGRNIYDPHLEIIFVKTVHHHDLFYDKYREHVSTHQIVNS